MENTQTQQPTKNKIHKIQNNLKKQLNGGEK